MKSFTKLVSEVAQPKPGDEIHFKAKHEVEKFPHPHAGDETFKGNTKKAPKRRADHEKGEDEEVYEGKKMDPVGQEDDDINNDGKVDSSDKYLHARRKAISKAIKQEEAELDEISKSTLGRYASKALNRGDIANRMSKSDDDSMGKIANKRLSGVKKAVDKLADKTGKKALATSIKKDVDTAKASGNAFARGGGVDDQGKSYNKATRNIGKMREEAELDESDDAKLQSVLSERRIQKAARKKETGLKRKTGESRAAYASRVVNRRNKMQKEEVEQLDELSPNKLHSYIKKATVSAVGTAARAGADTATGKVDPKKVRAANNRMRGISGASGRLADKANMSEDAYEEVPMMMRQLQFIEYAAGEISDYLNMGVDPEEWFQNKLAGLHQTMLSMYAYAQGEMQMSDSMYGEEFELDEAKDDVDVKWLVTWKKEQSAGKYIDASAFFPTEREARDYKGRLKSTRGVLRNSPEMKKIKQTEADKRALAKEEAELGEATPTKKAITRALQGMKVQPKEKVTVKKAPWEKNEEVELGEVTLSAVKRAVNYVDTRGVTRSRLTSTRPVQHDEYGQEKMRESLEEAVKPGRLKLDDGATITVSKKDADLVNQMFNDLNASNRKKMQDTMMSDKAGFDEIVGFAREAL